jgi:hypothetical protein
MNAIEKVYGIDFSGDHNKWSAGCTKSNIWVAAGIQQASTIRLERLTPVQALPGKAPPFDRLSAWLNSADEGFAAIDAPFSLPAAYLPDGPSAAWEKVAQLHGERRFCRGAELVGAFAPELGPRGRKIFRKTEQNWLSQRVNVRSTVWAGPRGGAPFAAACMTYWRGIKAPYGHLRMGRG